MKRTPIYIAVILLMTAVFTGCTSNKDKNKPEPSPVVTESVAPIKPEVTELPEQTNDLEEIIPTGTPDVENGIVEDTDNTSKDEAEKQAR